MIERDERPSHPMIAEQPGVNGGFPVVAPTRIAVQLIVEAFRETGSLGEIQAAFPQLSHAQVQAAFAFYRDYPERVDEDIERNERALRAIRLR